MDTYESALAEVAGQHQVEVRADLVLACKYRDKMQDDLAAVERQIALLEGLLVLATPAQAGSADDRLTLHAAMVKVLAAAPSRMMRAADLASAIERRGLYRMRDGRAVEPQQIHARVGHYPALFVREGTFIKLL